MSENGHNTTIDHAAIWARIESSEAKIFGAIKWAGGLCVAAILAWAGFSVNSSARQIELNMTNAAVYAELRAGQANLIDRMRDLYNAEIEHRKQTELELKEYHDILSTHLNQHRSK